MNTTLTALPASVVTKLVDISGKALTSFLAGLSNNSLSIGSPLPLKLHVVVSPPASPRLRVTGSRLGT